MANVNWIGTSSGNWSTGANWSTGKNPLTGDNVTIAPANSLTVTYSTGSLSIASLTTSVATFDITGGTLGIANGYDFGGALDISAGALRLVAGNFGDNFTNNVLQTGGNITLLGGANASTGIGASFNQVAGTITIANSTFDLQDAGSLGGTLTGGGRIEFDAGSTNVINLASGFALSTGSAEVRSGDLSFNESLSYAHGFELDSGGAISLNGNTLTLSGNTGLNGTITSGGLVNATGTGHLNGLQLENGLLLDITGSYVETGLVELGATGSGTLEIGKGGTLRIANNSSVIVGAGGGEVINNGLLLKSGGNIQNNGISIIAGDFVNAASATVSIALGTLEFQGPSSGFTTTLLGTIAGAGTAAFDQGNYLITSNQPVLSVARVLLEGSASITLTTSFTYGGSWAQTGGTLVVGSPGQTAGNLTWNGSTALDGGLLKGTGTVLGAGPVHLGTGMDLEGNLQFTFKGPVSQTGLIGLGELQDAITIATLTSGNTWSLAGSSQIAGFNGEIFNQGTFAKVSGAGTSEVQSGLFNTGTVSVDSGVLLLSGVGSLGGTVNGGGALEISGGYTLASGLQLSVGEIILEAHNPPNEAQATLAGNLTYANEWAQEGGTLALAGNTLTLNGVASLLSGAIVGTGTVISNGPGNLGTISLLQGANVQLNGFTEQSGNVTLTGGSTAPTLTIAGPSVYVMDANTHLGGQGDSVIGTVSVAGTLEASGGGTNVIAASIVDTGKILLSYGEMAFLGPLTGNGSITISNSATLDILTSNLVTNTITFGGGGGVLDLGNPTEFFGTIAGFATGNEVELQGFSFIGTTDSVSGNIVTINEANGSSLSLTFSANQTSSQLTLGIGPHGALALIHL
jgi:fibronectin-binding autotransporter adhesin